MGDRETMGMNINIKRVYMWGIEINVLIRQINEESEAENEGIETGCTKHDKLR